MKIQYQDYIYIYIPKIKKELGKIYSFVRNIKKTNIINKLLPLCDSCDICILIKNEGKKIKKIIT